MEVTITWSHITAIAAVLVTTGGALFGAIWKLMSLVRDDLKTFRTEVNDRFNKSDADSVAAHNAIGNNIRETRTELHAEIQAAKTELDTRIQTAKTEIRDDVKEVRADLRTWIGNQPPAPER